MMRSRSFRALGLSAVFSVLLSLTGSGCDDLEEQHEESPTLDVDDDAGEDWDYPYYLVIGGGLSETLSLLTVNGPGDFSLANDVQATAASISQTLVHDGELFAVCSLSHSVMVYDVHDLSILREVSVGIGNNPLALAFHKADHAFLANFVKGTVTEYDLADDTGAALATIPMPSGDALPRDEGVDETWSRPGALALAGGRLFVALSNLAAQYTAGGPGLVAVVDPDAKSLESVIELEGRDSVGLTFDEAAGVLYVVSAGDYYGDVGFVGNGMVESIDIASGEVVDAVETGGAPFDMVVDERGVAYLSNGGEGVLLSFDTATGAMREPIDIRASDESLSFASALAVDGNGYLYATEFNHDRLVVIDTLDDDRVIASFTVNDGPETLSFIR